MQIKIISAFVIVVITVSACNKSSSNTDYAAKANCTGTVPTYTNSIQNIIDNNCALSGCHNASSAKAGINLSDYTNASSQFKSNNKNLTSIHHGSGVDAMPKNKSKLPDSTINQLDCWVKNNCPQ